MGTSVYVGPLPLVRLEEDDVDPLLRAVPELSRPSTRTHLYSTMDISRWAIAELQDRMEPMGFRAEALAALDARSSIVVPDLASSRHVTGGSGRTYLVTRLEPVLSDLEQLTRAFGFEPHTDAATAAYRRYIANIPPEPDEAFFGLVALFLAASEARQSGDPMWVL